MTHPTEHDLVALLADLFRLPPEAITDNLTMGEIDVWDSLKHMELVFTLEEAFAIELSLEDIVEIQSVGQIKAVLAQHGMLVAHGP